MHTYMYVHATFPFIRLARGKLRLALQKNHRRRKQIVSWEVGAGRHLKAWKATKKYPDDNVKYWAMCTEWLLNEKSYQISHYKGIGFVPVNFFVEIDRFVNEEIFEVFFSLSSISIVFLWQVHVCVCHRSSKCLRNETVYDIVTSYERLRVHLHLHKLFQCSRFQRYPASYWCNNSHTYSKHQKVTNAQSQSSHVSGLFMSVLIVFRFQFHLSGQKRNSTVKK